MKKAMSTQSNTMQKEENWYEFFLCLFQEPWVRKLLVILHDAIIAGTSMVLAYVLRLGLGPASQYSMQATILNAIRYDEMEQDHQNRLRGSRAALIRSRSYLALKLGIEPAQGFPSIVRT